MKKITLLIMFLFSISSFSQEQVILDIYLLLNNNGNGDLRVSSNTGQVLYDNYGSPVTGSGYSTILNLMTASFPLTLEWRPGLSNAGCTVPLTFTYSYSDYTTGKTLIGGCAPEYFYIKSSYINILTAATATKGVCENFNLSGIKHYYSTTGNAPWIPCPSPFSAATLLGAAYRGPLHIKSDIEANYGNPKAIMQSKVITFNIIGCSPELDGQPVAENTKCKFESSGSVTLKFKTDLKAGDKFLFNIFKSGIFDKSIFVTNAEIVNKTFVWAGLAEGSYYIKYQSQTITDANTIVGATAIITDPFTVGSPEPLTFEITPLQPKCNGDQGAIQVTAKGGTIPYYYMIDGETLLQKHLLTADPINLSEGDHKVTVVDSNSCIEK